MPALQSDLDSCKTFTYRITDGVQALSWPITSELGGNFRVTVNPADIKQKDFPFIINYTVSGGKTGSYGQNEIKIICGS
jgi:hypothetical protein